MERIKGLGGIIKAGRIAVDGYFFFSSPLLHLNSIFFFFPQRTDKLGAIPRRQALPAVPEPRARFFRGVAGQGGAFVPDAWLRRDFRCDHERECRQHPPAKRRTKPNLRSGVCSRQPRQPFSGDREASTARPAECSFVNTACSVRIAACALSIRYAHLAHLALP